MATMPTILGAVYKSSFIIDEFGNYSLIKKSLQVQIA